MMEWFADTYYFLALGNPADAAHLRAIELAGRNTRHIVTTAWVITELADAMSAPMNRQAFLRLWHRLRSNAAIEIIPPQADLFEQGLDLFERRPDKSWSLTDCISFTVMTGRGLTDALTGDHHFEQAGFRALLKIT